jgi:hypothetical protein
VTSDRPSGDASRDDNLRDGDSRDGFDAGLQRHARLLATAPIVRHQNQLWSHKWDIVRLLAEHGPQTVAHILRSNIDEGEAALEALLSEGLVCVSGQSDPRSRVIALTLRGRTVLDTIRPPH